MCFVIITVTVFRTSSDETYESRIGTLLFLLVTSNSLFLTSYFVVHSRKCMRACISEACMHMNCPSVRTTFNPTVQLYLFKYICLDV